MLGIWHFSFTVSDIDQSIKFYRDRLGLELIHTQQQSNPYTRKLVGYPDADLKIAQLAVPGHPRGISTHDLELVEYVQPRGEKFGAERHRPGASHMAFAVEDAWQLYEELRSHGVEFVSEPQSITAGANRGGFTCYFLDPDDITLELVQPPLTRPI
jgi:catechol 2,3-dioxygenase-like lactoylglutathione lyase family enzyme